MGGAIARGLAAQGQVVTVTNRTREKAAAIDVDGITSIALADDPGANARIAAESDVLLLGVKPAMIADLVRDIAGSLRPGTILVSLAVGTTTASIEALVPDGVAVTRAMPNTPSTLGLGVTGVAGGSSATPEQVAVAARLFEAVGRVLVIDEAQIDALSSISGSGPAYVFLIVEELTATAERLGFTREQSATLVQGTVQGASALLADADVDPAELRRRVTSPKGTTERAIAELQAADLGAIFDRATAAAIARAAEIAAS